jgi:multidrug efflux pump subunit AcrA (membrane-fusion protein)
MFFSDITGWFRTISLLCLITALTAAGGACGGSAESKTKNSAESENKTERTDAPTTVSTATAVAREVPTFVQTTGSLVAQETSDVAPKVAGKVTNTMVSVGDFVQQGAVLAKLDENEARLQLRESEAAVVQAQAAVSQAQARLGLGASGSFQASDIPEVRAANANYEQTLAELRQAEANEKRYRELVETGDVSSQNYENYRTLRDTARARVNSAKQQLESAVNAAKQNNQAIRGAQAGVEAARARVATSKQAVADTIIRAPFSGFVSNRAVAVGEYVTTATPIITLLRTNPLKLQMQVGEGSVPGITIGMAVSLEVDAFKDRKFAGTVTAINPAIDPTSRAAVIEASVDNTGNLLRAGMFATARIAKQGGNNGIFVPRTAVVNDETTQSYRVFVIDKGVAKLRVVQIGTEEGETVQILNGISGDEKVATSNLSQLYEGAKVEAQ